MTLTTIIALIIVWILILLPTLIFWETEINSDKVRELIRPSGRLYRKSKVTLSLFLSSFVVILTIYSHFSLIYSVVLIEIISFVFIGVATKQNGEKSIKSIMSKESIVAYLIPSLFSYVLALVSLGLSANVTEAVFISLSRLEESKFSILGISMASLLMSISLLIKMGIFPFFIYTLNVNKGISWGGIVFVGIIAKLPVIVVMIYYGATIGPNILMLCGVISMVIAPIAAFSTQHAKKFMACSSLAAMGWLTAGIGCFKGASTVGIQNSPQWTFTVWAFYLVYSISTILLITVLNYVHPVFFSSYKGEIQGCNDEVGPRSNLWLRKVGIISLFTQMGIPPLAFFWAKLLIIIGVINSGKMILVVSLLLFTIIMVCFYFWMLWNISKERKKELLGIGISGLPNMVVRINLPHQIVGERGSSLNGVMVLSSILVCIMTGIVIWM